MGKRLDALAPVQYKQGEEVKTRWVKLGVAFETRGGGWQLLLDASPAPVDGQYKVVLMEPKERDTF